MTHPTIAADFGNFELKVCDGNTAPRAIRSIHFKLPRGVNPLKPYRNSPLVEVDGDRYHFGFQAGKYSSHEKTVIQDKSLLARLHLYASVEATEGRYRLIVSHHSPDVVASVLTKALKGKHSFVRNGKACDITITNVEIVSEGMGAYWAACHAGFTPVTGHTIVIDIGGGSWLYRVVDSSGEVIAESVFDRLGSYALASQIAHDERLKAPLRQFGITSPDPGVVMDGFCNGHTYAETNVSWKTWVDDYLDPWYRNIFGAVRADCTTHLPFTRRFIVTGGGAHLVRDNLKAHHAFVVMPDPNFANCIGMYEQFSNHLTVCA